MPTKEHTPSSTPSSKEPCQPTCLDRVKDQKDNRIDDLEKLFRAYQEGNEDKYSDDIGTFYDYGLAFDYVPSEDINEDKAVDED